MAVVRLLEEEWAQIQDDGPPEITSVLRHLLPRRSNAAVIDSDQIEPEGPSPLRVRGPRRAQRDSRSDNGVKQDFELMKKKSAYEKILSARQRLPAFAAKDDFLNALEKNRCVVVVGETGCGKTTQCAYLFSTLKKNDSVLIRSM